MSTKMQVEWRRTKVLEQLSKGDSQSEIAKVLQVDLSIISRDVYFKTASQSQHQKIH
jgi:transcriptional regulator